MAIFSKKTEEEKKETALDKPAVSSLEKAPSILIQPRLSEKSVSLNSINKYVFKVKISANKIEVKKAVEKFYGVKVQGVNIIRSEGKKRRYGRTAGRMSDFKKAIVTLTKDSKKPEIMKGV